uniref:Uncharacterized protein n=1 Tax=Glossina pallidipes TaxID=7398 RepID=A0A1A9Z4F7_GLOPL
MARGIYNSAAVSLAQKREIKKTHNIATYSLSLFEHILKARKLSYTPSWKRWIELKGFTVALTLAKLVIPNIQVESAYIFVVDEESWFTGKHKPNNDTFLFETLCKEGHSK